MSEKRIRNSTAEFLIFTGQAGEQSIEARYEDETVWLSQKLMAVFFDVDVRAINEHLKNIYSQQELPKEATIRKFRIVQQEGKREVSRQIGRIVNAYLDLAEDRARRRDTLRALCQAYRVRSTALFGSAARADFDAEHSDLDVLASLRAEKELLEEALSTEDAA